MRRGHGNGLYGGDIGRCGLVNMVALVSACGMDEKSIIFIERTHPSIDVDIIKLSTELPR